MEDPDPAEWGIEGYPSEEQSGKVSWILNKGLSVGKKILVTGFLISSAPVVLPALVAISLIGFACSVPSGLFLASYVCTEKLMSKLLPGSKPPPFLLGYGTEPDDKVFEIDENEEEDYYAELKEDIDMGKEEDMLEDARENIEMRIELVDNKDNGEVYEGKALVGNEHVQGGVRKDVNVIVEGNGRQEDFGEYEDAEMEEVPAIEIEVKIEGVREEEEKEPVIEESWYQPPVNEVQAVVIDIAGDEISGGVAENEGAPASEVTNIVVELCQNTDMKEDQESVRETRGLLEKIREEGMTDTGEDNKQSLEKLPADSGEADQQVNGNTKEFGMPLEDRKDYGNIRMEKPHGVIEHKREENNNDEISKESSEMKEMGYIENVDAMPEETKPIEIVGGLLTKRNVDNSLEAERLKVEMVGTKEGQKPNEDKPSALQGGRANDNINNNDVLQDYLLEKEKEIVISTNADAREIADESVFDLYDNRNRVSQHYSHTDYDAAGGNEKSSSYANHETADKMEETADKTELPVAGISSEKDINMASSKVLYSEKKMWHQINAMRKIVGYKGAKQATCFEELKALYLFTGVEPPASFRDPSDLKEMNDKLRFLMSIVGVK